MGHRSYLRSDNKFRVYRQDRAAMAQGEPDQDHLYRARQPVAERVCGKLPWPFPGRMLEPGATVDFDRNVRVVVGDYRQE